MNVPGVSPSDCIDELRIDRFSRGLLDGDDELSVEAHLAVCESCLFRATDCQWADSDSNSDSREEQRYYDEPECQSLKDDLRRHIANISAIAGTLSSDTTLFDIQLPKELRALEFGPEIGRGRMGAVFRARQVLLDREVAVKVLTSGPRLDSERRLKMISEARAVAKLSHPNIVQAFDVVDCGSGSVAAIFVMEIVADQNGGIQTLESRLKAGWRPSRREAVALVQTLCLAVHHAHESRIIHRDLKPANILLGRGAVPKIADFGIAAVGMGGADAGAAGTPLYMAPEQWSPCPPKAESDIYALGVILFELLAGKPPFVGTLDEIRSRVQSECPQDLREIGVPVDLAAIVGRCLKKEPCDRYASAADLAGDLRRFSERRTVVARPPKAWERPLYALKRIPLIVAASLVVGIAVSAWGLNAAFTSSNLAKVLVEADRLIVSARSHCERGDVKGGLEAFLEARELLPEGHARRAYIDSCLEHWSRWLPAVRTTYQLPERVRFVAESPRGDYFLSGDDVGNVHQVFFDQRPSKRWHVLSNSVGTIAVNCEGSLAAVSGFQEVGLVDLTVGAVRQSLKVPRLAVSACGFLKRGKVIATASRRDVKPLRLWDAATGDEIRFDSAERGQVERWYSSKDGSLAAASMSDGRCWIWDGDEASPIVMLPSSGSGAVPAAFLGRTIATGGDRLRVWNERGERIDEMPVPYEFQIVHLVASDDKTLVANWKYNAGYSLQTWKLGEKKWSERISPRSESVTDLSLGRTLSDRLMICDQSKVCDLEQVPSGVETFCLPVKRSFAQICLCRNDRRILAAAGNNKWLDPDGGPGAGYIVSWDLSNGEEVVPDRVVNRSPPSNLVVSESSGIYAFSTQTSLGIRIAPINGAEAGDSLPGHPVGVSSLAFHPDGKRLFSGGFDKTVRFWNLDSRKQIFEGFHSDYVVALAFSPLGELAASADLKGRIRLWSVGETMSSMADVVVDFPVREITFSEQGNRLAVGGDKGQVTVFFAGASGLQVEREVLANDFVSGLCFCRNDSELFVATRSLKSAVTIFDTTFWEPIGRAGGVGASFGLSQAESGRIATIRNGTSISVETASSTPVRRSTAEWHEWINARSGKNIAVGD